MADAEAVAEAVVRGCELLEEFANFGADRLSTIVAEDTDHQGTVFALILIAHRAIVETAKVLDVDPSLVRRAIQAQALDQRNIQRGATPATSGQRD